MSTELTFKSVCDTIKQRGKQDAKLLEAVDSLLGLALICSPVVLGPAAAAVLPTLAIKNEVVKIGKGVFDKLTKIKDEDYLQRYETMRTAYGLLIFTSFFDALDALIPDALRAELRLFDYERAFLVKDGVRKSSVRDTSETVCIVQDAPIAMVALVFPHPTETLTEQCARQRKLWTQMSQGFLDFVQKLALWEKAPKKRQAALLSGLDKIEEEAAKRFEAQYFELARKFEDFAVWANLQAHKGTKALIGELSDYVKQHAKLSAGSEKSIDVGFAKLRQVVLSIPETWRTEQAVQIAESFNKHYQARINEPLIDDKEIGDEDAPRLSFPKVCDAFVPQAFRVLRQASSKSRRLEDEATWNEVPRRGDLGAFLLSYLSSPYGTEAPLLILGHPGSGKSLLTTVLSAQLMSNQFTAIRVPLREVNADADIQTQIEEFIKRISGVSFDSWNKLRAQFKNCPPVVILDGYDELLQASGQVFASYIMEAQRFQQFQTEQGWPVRIIITSRVTLIDKAAVPVGATIVRLLEFDEDQRARWTAIWNSANAGYFREAKIKNFALPSAKDKGSEKILNLAEQPLLLLMLALYDSQDNQLGTSKGLDRTKLYDSLLRRFVIRERGKEKGFNDERAKERKNALSIEMQRLGVAALGMYNRRKVHILSTELDDDLAFFELEREVTAKSGKALSQADLLLGSFFFVHKSKAQHTSGAEETHEETSAFEFLHNTFGEFLTADFIIRRAVAQVEALRAAEANEALRSMIDKMMGTADGFERDWFASLVYTPLFTRPVILEMIREWAPHVLKEYSLAEDVFVGTLDKIVLNQTKRLLSKREMPQIMRKETAQEGYRVPFGDHPLVGHIAIYSINLVLLRLVFGKEPFIFDETEIASHEDGTRPWDRLMNIWRSWFSLENLNGLTAVMVADRNEKRIKVAATDKFQAQETTGKLQEFYNVALSLGDDVSASIAGFYLFDPMKESATELIKLEKMVLAEGLDLGVPALLARLHVFARNFDESPDEFAKLGRDVLEQAMRSNRRDQIESICQVIARTLEQASLRRIRGTNRVRVFRDIFDPQFTTLLIMRDARSARGILSLAKRLHDTEWLFEVTRRFIDVLPHEMPLLGLERENSSSGDSVEWPLLFRELASAGSLYSRAARGDISSKYLDRLFDPYPLLELSKLNPEGALAYLQILRQLGGGHHFEEVFFRLMPPEEFFERFFHPRQILELIERNPEGVLAYLQILREFSGGRYFEEFVSRRMPPEEFFERFFHPRYQLERIELNPEGTLTYLQILREFSGGRYFEEFVSHWMPPEEFFERFFHPRHLLELIELNPDGALAYLQILREFGGGRFEEVFFRRMPPEEFFERSFHPRQILELIERNPDGALAYLQILREFGGGHFQEFLFRRMPREEFFDRMFDNRWLEFLRVGRIASLAAWLSFVRLFNSEVAVSKFDQVLRSFFADRSSFTRLSTLPIGSLPDLRWLAEQSNSDTLRSLIAELAS
jgi:hypothetical protein